MKKIYTLICVLGLTLIGFSQGQKTFNNELAKPKKQMAYNRSILHNKNANALAKTSTANSGWFNFGTEAETLYGVTSSLNSNYLFPDSMGYGEFGVGNFAPCWLHHLAEEVDFRSLIFSNTAATNWVAAAPTSPFKIDSMSIFYGYTRNHPNLNIVDTLIVTVYDGPLTGTGVLATGGFLNTAGFPGGADTLSFRRLGYNQTKNAIASASPTTSIPANQYKFKVLLTIADTAITVYRDKSFALPIPFSSIANKLTIGSVMFKPGYTYTLTQQIDATANAFFFTSLEENGDGGGAGTLMNYLDCGFGSALCDYSQSHVLTQDVRYNMAGTWNGRFIPTLAYAQSYGFEHHLISFHLTDDMTTGIKESAQTDIALGQNIPNPFTKESTVKYNLIKDASSAVFIVTDVMGRIISSEKVGTTTGNHSIKLGAYAAGLYYYSLNVDGNISTKKMIVE
jgi:hypothetical protein